jgi:hypothetical protein
MVKYLKNTRPDLDLWPLIKYSPKKAKSEKVKYNKKIKRIL